MLHGFLPFSLVSLTELCSFWYGLKDVFTLHKLADKVVLDDKLKLMTSQAVERTWIHTGSLRSLRYCLGGRDNTASYAGYRTGGSGANRLKKKIALFI